MPIVLVWTETCNRVIVVSCATPGKPYSRKCGTNESNIPQDEELINKKRFDYFYFATIIKTISASYFH